ncbi:putative leucine-rich repeat-containing protein DDB_G0290503 [Drosophila kikkawai]|uniref:Leucine-rich repeat-containing protein DDB_G0290503 n=1 Tax=Drosophila kikkawai TaxID=30033 RepID=A0ABM3C7V3_DROKI|nr:uncharacterized protein LOC121502893 [Drosophila kikkawai]
MQLPLLHRSTQMAVLKKLIRRKVREVRWRRQRAQRRLEIMRHIRWELLKLMQHLIDLRQRDAGQERRQQARRSVSGMLHMYKRWLGNWTRAIKNHGQLIRQQEQEKRRLNSRLRLLRKRLRKHRRPRHLVDRCLEKLAKAVKRWQRRPDYHQYFEGQKLIWAQEAEEVRRYLAEIRGKSPKRRKSYRRKSLGLHIDLQNFGSFWKFEVLRKKRKLRKIQAPSQGPPPEWTVYRIPKRPLRYRRIRKNKPINKTIHLNPGELDAENEPMSKRIQFNLDGDKKRKRRRMSSRKPSENDPLGPSLKEMQQLFQQLTYHNPGEQKVSTAFARDSKRNRHSKGKAAKLDLFEELENAINITKPQSKLLSSKRRRDARNQVNFNLNRLRAIGSALRSNILKSKDAKKTKLVNEKVSEDLGGLKINHKKHPSLSDSMESKELGDSSDLIIPHKYGRKPKSKSGDEKIKKALDALKINDNKDPSSRVSKESKDFRDKYTRKPKSKSGDEKTGKPMDDLKRNNKKDSKGGHVVESKDLWDTSDFLHPATKHHKKIQKKKKPKRGQSSDNDTDLTKKKLISPKYVYESMSDLASITNSAIFVSESELLSSKRKIDGNKQVKRLRTVDTPKFKYAKKPELVDEKIDEELGALKLNYKKDLSDGDSVESKDLLDSSYLLIQHKYSRKLKSKSRDEKNIKTSDALKIYHNMDSSPRVSKESKHLRDSSDPLTSHKHARKSKSKSNQNIEKPMDALKVENKKVDKVTELRSNVLKSKYAKKPKLVDEQISDDLGARKPKLSSLDEKIIKALEALKMNRDPSPRVSKESKELRDSLDPLTSHKHARKSKSGDEKIGKPMDDLKVDNKGRKVVETKDLWDTSDLLHSSTTPQKKIQKKRKSKRGLSSQSSEDDSDLMMKKLTKRKHKYEKSASVEASVTNSAASLSESVKKLVMENDPRRKFIRKSIGFGLPHADFQPKPRTERSRKSVHGRRSVFKDSLRKEYKDNDKSGDSADFKADHQFDDQNVSPAGGIMDYPDGQKPDNTARRLGPSVVFIADVKIEDPERSNSDPEIDDQRSNQDIKKTGEDQDKSKTSKNQNKIPSLEQARNLKNIDLDLLPQVGKFGSLTGSASEVEAMSDLESVYNESTASFPRKYNIKNLKSNAKYRPIQYFLKDVIESNPILDHAPNVQGLMQAVGKHYMWDHLTDFHNELLAGGISKHDIKRLLTEKYLTYLKIIRKGKLPTDKKADSGSLASGYASNTHSQMDHLRNLRFWSRARLTSRLFHFGNQGENETQSQVTLTVPKPDNATLQQQLKAERIKKDDDRLRRLLPTSQISTSLSATSSMMWEVASEEEEDLRQIEERYSIENLNRMMTEHKLRFQAMERERKMSRQENSSQEKSSQEKSSQKKCCQDKVDSKYKLMVEHSDSQLEQPPPKRPSTQTSKSRDGQPLRPIQQLFYSPRKTCREQQIIKLYSEGSSDEQEEGNQEDQDSGTEMCPKCGVKVDIPYSIPSPKASSAILSSGSIEACAKNELLVNTMADVCTRCGYVHNEANPCTQPPEDQRKTVVLRLIKAVQAVRSTSQPSKCSESCSCRKIFNWQEKDLSCTSKLRRVEPRVRRCPGADEGGGDG